MNKIGGATDIQFGNLVKIVINVIIVLALFFFIGLIVYSLLSKEKCDNSNEWVSVEKALEQIDKSGTALQIPFRNTQCKLVSFVPSQGYSYQLDNRFLSDKPLICLCLIDGAKCKPVSPCYKFENINTILSVDEKSLDTTDYGDGLIFLNFKKEDFNLVIDFMSSEMEYNEYRFDINDPNNYIKKVILDSSTDLSSYSLSLIPLDRYSMELNQRLGQEFKAYSLSFEPKINPNQIKDLGLVISFDSQWDIEPLERNLVQGRTDYAFSHGSIHFKYNNKELTKEKKINPDLSSNENQLFYEVKVEEKGIPDEIVLLTQ